MGFPALIVDSFEESQDPMFNVKSWASCRTETCRFGHIVVGKSVESRSHSTMAPIAIGLAANGT